MSENERSAGVRRGAEAIMIDIAIRLGILGLFVYWAFLLIGPFVIVVLWAVILAVAVYPVHFWVKTRLGGRGGLASFLITLIGLAIIVGPATVLVKGLIGSAEMLTTGLENGTLTLPPPPDSVRGWPVIGEKLYGAWSLASTNLGVFLSSNSSLILGAGGSLLGKAAGLGVGVLTFAVSVLIAGFLYTPGPRLAQGARVLAKRIVAERGEKFVDLAGATIRNVSRGVIGISLLQALLAGVGLMLADIPGAEVITFGVLILGIIQIGPGLLLTPVIIWVWTAMDTTTALIFTAYMVPVTLMDNFLKPIVMARGLETPMLVIFIGVIGGTLAHGLIGLFLGPIVLAVFYELLVAWVKEGTPEAGTEFQS